MKPFSRIKFNLIFDIFLIFLLVNVFIFPNGYERLLLVIAVPPVLVIHNIITLIWGLVKKDKYLIIYSIILLIISSILIYYIKEEFKHTTLKIGG